MNSVMQHVFARECYGRKYFENGPVREIYLRVDSVVGILRRKKKKKKKNETTTVPYNVGPFIMAPNLFFFFLFLLNFKRVLFSIYVSKSVLCLIWNSRIINDLFIRCLCVVVSILELPLVINNFGIPTHRFDVIARVND